MNIVSRATSDIKKGKLKGEKERGRETGTTVR